MAHTYIPPEVAAREAAEAFVKELQRKCIDMGARPRNVSEFFAERVDICGCSARNYFRDPGLIQARTMRRIVKAFSPDIGVLLRFLGYTPQDIARFRKGAAQ